MAITKFDVFLNPKHLDDVVKELKKGFSSDAEESPSITHNPEDNNYSLWGYMVDGTGSRHSLQDFGRLIYSKDKSALHLLTSPPIIDETCSSYPLEFFIGEYDINSTIKTLVDKYKI